MEDKDIMARLDELNKQNDIQGRIDQIRDEVNTNTAEKPKEVPPTNDVDLDDILNKVLRQGIVDTAINTAIDTGINKKQSGRSR